MGKILGPFLLAFGTVVAIGAGMKTAEQAGAPYGVLVTAVVMLFVVLALVGLIDRSPKGG